VTRPLPGDLALVAAGAAAGALTRWAVVPLDQDAAIWATLAVNVVGSFLLGVLPAVPAVRRSRRAALVLGPGVLGGFTTVSAWAGQVTGLAHEGRESVAGLLLVATVAATLLAAHLGRHCARHVSPEALP
jgi:fluoride exporter